MDRQDIARQAMIEYSMLNSITGTLRAIIDWEPRGPHGTRKLSSLGFVAQSLERHLSRLMAIEEQDGYMRIALSSAPQFATQIDKLRAEHDEFRVTLREIVHRLENMKPGDQQPLAEVCDSLGQLLQRIDEHSQHETDIMQEAFLRDVGSAD
ncbi:MAG: hemerythrin domain-containing protein [Pirellulales bacterium]|nr:hemerythrin domain-containing protein [Pirellulales bacterium]